MADLPGGQAKGAHFLSRLKFAIKVAACGALFCATGSTHIHAAELKHGVVRAA